MCATLLHGIRPHSFGGPREEQHSYWQRTQSTFRLHPKIDNFWMDFFWRMTLALLFKSNHCGSWWSILCQYVQNVHPPAKACNWLWSLRNAQKVQLMHSFFKTPLQCNFTMKSAVQWDAMHYSVARLFCNFTTVQFYDVQCTTWNNYPTTPPQCNYKM